jgi:cyanate permease
MFNLAHPLEAAFGWRAIWWFGALLALLALILFAFVVSAPPKAEARAQTAPPPSSALAQGLLNPPAWLLSLGFGAFAFVLLGYTSWAPTFLTEGLHIDPALASSYASLIFLAAIPATVIAGWLINRLRHRHRLLVAAYLLTTGLLAWGFRLESRAVAVPYMIALGFLSNLIPTATLTIAPETAPDAKSASLALAIVTVGSNAGAMAGPPAIGALLSAGSWRAGGAGLVIMGIVGTIVAGCVSRTLKGDRHSR